MTTEHTQYYFHRNTSLVDLCRIGLIFGCMLFSLPQHAMALITTPSALTFTGTQGSANPPAQSVMFSKEGDRTKTWTVSAASPWVAVSPSSGTIATESDQIAVNVNLAGLAAGNYSSSIVITTESLKGRFIKTSIPVTLTVQPASSTAGFSISPASLQYSGTVGGPNITAGVTITNTTLAAITVTWHDNIGWLVATSGDTVTIPSGGSATITHTASTAALWPGTFSGVATVTGGGVTKQVPVSITVTQVSNTAPSIGLAPGNLSFSGTVGGTNPSAQAISVSNSGGGTLTWTASDNAAWLTLAPAAGTNSGTVAASVNLTGLAAGTYSGTVTVAATGATSKTIPVSLTVSPTATTTSPIIGLSQTSLAFTGTAGGTNPTAQSFTVSNTGAGTLTWTASDNAAWLTLAPAAGTNSGTVAASVNLTGLAAGTYSGTISVAATGAVTKSLPVSLTVNPATTTTSTATLTWGMNAETDLSGYKVYVGTQSGVYSAPINVGKVATYQVTNLTRGTTYFFSITAYDAAGNESPHSAEVSKSIF